MSKVNEEMVMTYLRNRWPEGAIFPNFIDAIASMNGWLPLSRGELMTVHYEGREYEIKRVDTPNSP